MLQLFHTSCCINCFDTFGLANIGAQILVARNLELPFRTVLLCDGWVMSVQQSKDLVRSCWRNRKHSQGSTTRKTMAQTGTGRVIA